MVEAKPVTWDEGAGGAMAASERSVVGTFGELEATIGDVEAAVVAVDEVAGGVLGLRGLVGSDIC